MLAGLAILRAQRQVRRFSFKYSQGAFREDEIFDSAMSVPGRYLLEIGSRILKQVDGAEWVVAGNPLLPLTGDLLAQWADGWSEGATVFVSSDGAPVCYRLPRRLFDGLGRFLLLLSAIDGALDRCLLEAVLGEEVAVEKTSLPPLVGALGSNPNGWVNGDQRLEALKIQCMRAIALIKRRSGWRDLPFATFYPMHAGDVLFMSVASRVTTDRLFSRHVVCSSYADIPSSCGSRLESIDLEMPWIPRDGSVSEFSYFSDAMKRLERSGVDDNFIIFSRILRIYFNSPFHLVDQARFSLGEHLSSFEDTVHGGLFNISDRCQKSTSPLKVLFHLNGGWSLKTYPEKKIRQVIFILKNIGIEVTVLSRPDLEDMGIHSEESADSMTLLRLIKAHHVFVGVDSFPHHFSRLVARWPTVGLFGNTKPCNSDARYGEGYRASDRSLSCNRCGAYDRCPLLGRKDCINYATPEKVVADILDLAHEIYGYEVNG